MASWLALALFAWALPLAGCGSSGQTGSSCSASSQCVSGLSCVGPDDSRGCGIAPMRQCASDTDCPSGEVCNAVADSCSSSGVGSQCGAKCGACQTGFRCNAGGACEPLPCDQGYQCPSYQRCDTTVAHMQGPVYNRTQGCVDIACMSDTDCPVGKSCVNTYCQDSLGSCQQVLAVP